MASPPVVLVLPLKGGSWRVAEDDGNALHEFPDKDSAVRFAENWALIHGPCEVKVYDEHGAVERVITPPRTSPQTE